MLEGSYLTLQTENAYAGAKAPPEVKRTVDPEKARRVAVEFEAFFLSQVFQPMFTNVEPAEPFGAGPGEEMWRSLQIDEYGKAVARAGGVGIADAVYREILKLQEGQ